MKSLCLIFISVFLLTTFTNSGCKKNTTCGCATSDIKYQLQNINGTLSFYQFKNKWVFSYQPSPGSVSNFFPCNLSQDSLQTILQGANQNEVFQVKFSGHVKSSCPDEVFGITSGVTTFDYISLDSLKRN